MNRMTIKSSEIATLDFFYEDDGGYIAFTPIDPMARLRNFQHIGYAIAYYNKELKRVRMMKLAIKNTLEKFNAPSFAAR